MNRAVNGILNGILQCNIPLGISFEACYFFLQKRFNTNAWPTFFIFQGNQIIIPASLDGAGFSQESECPVCSFKIE